jgi:hypothetical protein
MYFWILFATAQKANYQMQIKANLSCTLNKNLIFSWINENSRVNFIEPCKFTVESGGKK